MVAEAGHRKNEGKPQIGLVPPEAIMAMAEVLTKGLEKYAYKDLTLNSVLEILKEELTCQLKLNLICVPVVKKVTAEDFVDLVMRNNFENEIHSLLSDNEKTPLIGRRKTKSVTKRTRESIILNQKTRKEEKEFTENGTLKRLDCQKKLLICFYKNKIIPVESAVEVLKYAPDIWIMTIRQDSQEVFFVAGAITESECLVTLAKGCLEHCGILGSSQLQNLLINPKTNNLSLYEKAQWTKGMDWSKHYDAAQRHLLKWQSGIDLDEETGLNHLAHALTNLSFLLTYSIRNIGKDDRCKNPLKQKTITTTQT